MSPRSPIQNAARAAFDAPSLVDADTIEAFARHAIEAASLPVDFPDPRWLLLRLGVRFRPGHPWGSAGAMRVRDVVVYRPRGPRSQGIALTHELAHVLLERSRIEHSEHDAWLLTLALAAPWIELRTLMRDATWSMAILVRNQRYAPRWALRLRVSMVRAKLGSKEALDGMSDLWDHKHADRDCLPVRTGPSACDATPARGSPGRAPEEILGPPGAGAPDLDAR